MPSPTYQWTKALLAYMRSNLWSILESMKWIRGYGTRLVWNSVMSTLRAPSNLREAVGGDHLRDETVQVGVGWALDIEAATADVVDRLVVEHDSNVGVLKERVGGEHSVVWLDN